MYSLRDVFKKEYKYNRAILNSVNTNTPIYVFQKEGTRLFLQGIFRYESDHHDPSDGSRWFILQKVSTLTTDKVMTEDEYNRELQKQVNRSKQDSIYLLLKFTIIFIFCHDFNRELQKQVNRSKQDSTKKRESR